MFFPSIPGSSLAPTGLTYKCKSTALPGSTLEVVKIELHGVAKQEAGRATYEHTFSAVFMETIDYTTYQAFRAWRDYARSWKSNTGASSQAYKVNLELDLYDNAGNKGSTVILAGCFPLQIQDVTFDGSQSAIYELTTQFSFDYLDDSISF